MVCTLKILQMSGRDQHMNSGHTKAPRTWGYRLIRKPLRKKLGRRKEKGPQQKK